MRAELLTGEQEKDLAVMVQDLLHLEQVAKDLAVKLGRTPSDMEWMEAADGQGDFEDITTALTGFQQRVHAGRSAKQVGLLSAGSCAGSRHCHLHGGRICTNTSSVGLACELCWLFCSFSAHSQLVSTSGTHASVMVIVAS